MHKKVLQNAHFKNRFALQTDGEIGQIDRFETAPPNQKQGWNKIYEKKQYEPTASARPKHFFVQRQPPRFRFPTDSRSNFAANGWKTP